MTAMAAVSMSAFAATELTEGTDYYIRNAKTGMWLNGGYTWGTKAIVKEQARAFQFTKEGDYMVLSSSCGKVKVDGPNDNGVSEFWVDGGEDNQALWVVEPQNDGTFMFKFGNSVMTIDQNGEGENVMLTYGDAYDAGIIEDSWESWLGALQSYNFYAASVAAYETDDAKYWEVYNLDEMKAMLTQASEEDPMDATFLIKAYMLDRNDSDNSTAWECFFNGVKVPVGHISEDDEDDLLIFPPYGWGFHIEDYTAWAIEGTYGWFNGDNLAGTAVVSQSVEGVPAGNYEVYYHVVDQPNTEFSLTVNDIEGEVSEWENEDGEAVDLWYASATGVLANRDQVKKVSFTVGDDGKLAIAMTKECEADAQNRFAYKSFVIKCTKAAEVAAVEGIAIDNANAPVEYYNIQGMKVANPSNGLYIVKQGNNVTKQIIRK